MSEYEHDSIHTGDKTVNMKKHDSIHTGDKRVQVERLQRQTKATGNGNGTSKLNILLFLCFK